MSNSNRNSIGNGYETLEFVLEPVSAQQSIYELVREEPVDSFVILVDSLSQHSSTSPHRVSLGMSTMKYM